MKSQWRDESNGNWNREILVIIRIGGVGVRYKSNGRKGEIIGKGTRLFNSYYLWNEK